MVRAFFKTVPVPCCGVALALAALGRLLGSYSIPGAEPVLVGCSIFFIGLIVGKALLWPRVLANDLTDPVLGSVFGTFFMTFTQLSTYLIGFSHLLASAVWILAVLGHAALIVWFTLYRASQPRLSDVFTTWFVCYVGIAAGALTAPYFDFEAVGMALVWFGLAAYAVLLALVTARYVLREVPKGAQPTFCIYAAPASLMLATYLSCASQPSIPLTLGLGLLGQLMLIMVITQVPRFILNGFFPSYAAMTFPFVVTATALRNAAGFWTAEGLTWTSPLSAIATGEVVLATIMVLFVAIHYLRFITGNARSLRPSGQKPLG